MINDLCNYGSGAAGEPLLTKAEMEVLLQESAQHLKTASLLLGLPVESLEHPPASQSKPPRGGDL